MRHIDARRKTPFGSWVHRYTPRRLRADLEVAGHPLTVQSVYDWLAGRTNPRPDVARAITRLSDGELGLTDVYRHRDDLERS